MTILTDGLSNTEIAKAAKAGTRLLTVIQKQVLFVMRVETARKPCPNCGELHNLPEAAGVAVDDFDFGSHGPNGDRIGKCRKCERTLVFTLPWPTGDWYWRLDPDEGASEADKRHHDRIADHIDGYDRDDLGESPDR